MQSNDKSLFVDSSCIWVSIIEELSQIFIYYTKYFTRKNMLYQFNYAIVGIIYKKIIDIEKEIAESAS